MKAGLEVDTNPRRLNGVDAQPELLERWFLETTSSSRQPGQELSGLIRLGGKRYHQTSAEDTLVVDFSGGYQRLLREALSIALRLSVRDRSERDSLRDYFRIGGRLAIGWKPFGNLRLNLGPRLQAFQYKPDVTLSNISIGGQASLSWQVSEGLSIGGSYSLIEREYRSRQLFDENGILRYIEEQARVDLSQMVVFSLNARYNYMASLDFVLHRNSSNSFGKELTRLIARMTAAVPLWFGLILNGQVSVQRTTFDTAVMIDETFTIDDENRNSLALALSRHLWQRLAAEMRYNWYSQEFGGDEVVYSRHLFYLGLVLSLGE